MEPQSSPVPTVPVPPPSKPVVPPVPTAFPKKNNLVVILLSIFLAITLLISGYLFLQVQSLTKQLAQLQIQPTPLSTEIEKSICKPTYEVVKTPELSAEQVYSEECLNKENENDCLRVDIYNLAKKDFSKPDGIPDCKWAKFTN